MHIQSFFLYGLSKTSLCMNLSEQVNMIKRKHYKKVQYSSERHFHRIVHMLAWKAVNTLNKMSIYISFQMTKLNKTYKTHQRPFFIGFIC